MDAGAPDKARWERYIYSISSIRIAYCGDSRSPLRGVQWLWPKPTGAPGSSKALQQISSVQRDAINPPNIVKAVMKAPVLVGACMVHSRRGMINTGHKIQEPICSIYKYV